jgi:hypothetical protein
VGNEQKRVCEVIPCVLGAVDWAKIEVVRYFAIRRSTISSSVGSGNSWSGEAEKPAVLVPFCSLRSEREEVELSQQLVTVIWCVKARNECSLRLAWIVNVLTLFSCSSVELSI